MYWPIYGEHQSNSSTLALSFIFPVVGKHSALKDGLSGITVTISINSLALNRSPSPPSVSSIVLKLLNAVSHVYNFFPVKRNS